MPLTFILKQLRYNIKVNFDTPIKTLVQPLHVVILFCVRAVFLLPTAIAPRSLKCKIVIIVKQINPHHTDSLANRQYQIVQRGIHQEIENVS